MFELASALFSIADANEFRFARFYIVCEVVPLGAPESSLIVCGLSDTSSRSVKTWPRHGSSHLAKAAELEIPYFVIRILPPVFAGTPELRSLTRITGTANLRCLLPQYLSLPQLLFLCVANKGKCANRKKQFPSENFL